MSSAGQAQLRLREQSDFENGMQQESAGPMRDPSLRFFSVPDNLGGE